MSEEAVRQPVETFKMKGGIEAAVWENQVQRDGRAFTRHSVTLRKSYYDRELGEYRHSSTLFPDDLPRARLALGKAYDYIMCRASDPEEEGGEGDL